MVSLVGSMEPELSNYLITHFNICVTWILLILSVSREHIRKCKYFIGSPSLSLSLIKVIFKMCQWQFSTDGKAVYIKIETNLVESTLE